MKKGKIVAVFLPLLLAVLITGCRPSPAVVHYQASTDGRTGQQTNQINNRIGVTPADEATASRDGGKAKNFNEKTAGTYSSAADSKPGDQGGTKYNPDINDDNAAGGVRGKTQSGSSNEAGGGAGAGSGPGQIYDDQGDQVKPPDKGKRIAATGGYADMVEMLGGKLVATGADLSDPNGMFAEIFPDVKNAAPAWSGFEAWKGNTADIDKIIKAKPEAVLYAAGDLTQSQINKLKAAGVNPVLMPDLYLTTDIKTAVTIVGDVIGDNSANGGVNAPVLAQRFNSYYEANMSLCTSSITPLFADGLNYDVRDYWNQVRSNNSVDFGSPNSFRINPANNQKIILSCQYTCQSVFSNAPLAYYMGIAGLEYIDQDYNFAFQNTLNDYNLSFADLNYFSNKQGIGYLEKHQSLGKDSTTYSGFTYEYGSTPGVYLYDTQEKITHDLAYVHDSFLLPYMLMQPRGAYSWVEGGPEGALEPVWIASKIYPNISAFGGNAEGYMRNKVRDFYKTFYRYNLSEDQITKILAGPVN